MRVCLRKEGAEAKFNLLQHIWRSLHDLFIARGCPLPNVREGRDGMGGQSDSPRFIEVECALLFVAL